MPGPIGGETPHARATWWEERLALPVSWKPAEGHEATVLVAHVISKPDVRGSRTASSPPRPDSLPPGPRRRRMDARATTASRASRPTSGARSTAVELRRRTSTGSTRRSGASAPRTRLKLGRGFIVTAGLRYDDHSQFGERLEPARQPLLALRRRPLEGARLGRHGLPRADGRRALLPVRRKPELEARAVDLVRDRRRALPAASGRVEASLFWNDFRDLIVYDFSRVPGLQRGARPHAGRRGRLAAGGHPAVLLDIGYTYLDPVDRDTGLPLIRRPHHRGYLAASVAGLGSHGLPAADGRRGPAGQRRPDRRARREARRTCGSTASLRYQLGPVAPVRAAPEPDRPPLRGGGGYPARQAPRRGGARESKRGSDAAHHEGLHENGRRRHDGPGFGPARAEGIAAHRGLRHGRRAQQRDRRGPRGRV